MQKFGGTTKSIMVSLKKAYAATPNNESFHILLHEGVDIGMYGRFCQNKNFLDAKITNCFYSWCSAARELC